MIAEKKKAYQKKHPEKYRAAAKRDWAKRKAFRKLPYSERVERVTESIEKRKRRGK